MTEREHIMPDNEPMPGQGTPPEAQGPDAGPQPIATPHSPEPVVGPGAPPTPEMGVPSTGAGRGQELGEVPESAEDERAAEDLPDDQQARMRALEMLDDKEGKDASSLIAIANLARIPKEEYIDLLRAKNYDPTIVDEVINRRDEIRPIEEQVPAEPEVEPLVAEGEEETAEGEGEEQLPTGEKEPSVIDQAKAAIASKDPTKMQTALAALKDKLYNGETGLLRKERRIKRLLIKPSTSILIVLAIAYISLLTWMTSGATKRVGK
jgi:hypothetical protein